jgi:hypothetical protein
MDGVPLSVGRDGDAAVVARVSELGAADLEPLAALLQVAPRVHREEVAVEPPQPLSLDALGPIE